MAVTVPPASSESPRRRTLLLALRTLGTLALAAWLIGVMDWSSVWSAMRGADYRLLVLVLVLLAIGPVLSAYKWRALLAIHGIHYPMTRLTRWYVASIFLSQFLPTTIGGDAYRAYKTMQSRRSRSRAVIAIVVERASGIAALVAMGFLAAYWLQHDSQTVLPSLVVVGGSIAGAVGVILTWVLIRAPQVLSAPRWRFAARVMDGVVTVIGEFRAHPRQCNIALVLSFAFHLDRIAVIWFTLAALGHPPGLLELIVATMVVEIASFLPISLGGLGVAEGSFVYVMGLFGAAAEPALAAMLLIRVLLVPLHLLGAGFYLAEGRRPRGDLPVAHSREWRATSSPSR